VLSLCLGLALSMSIPVLERCARSDLQSVLQEQAHVDTFPPAAGKHS
jgi:hypothetical protein